MLTIQNGAIMVNGVGSITPGAALTNWAFIGVNGALSITGNSDNFGFIQMGYCCNTVGPHTLSISGTLTNEAGGRVFLDYTGTSATLGGLNNNGHFVVNYGNTLNLTNQPNGLPDVVAGSIFTLAGTFNAGPNNGLYHLTGVEGYLGLFNGQTTTTTPIGGTFTVGSTGYVEVATGTTFDVNGNVVVQPAASSASTIRHQRE